MPITRRQTEKDRAGFTLIELLVAMTVLVLIFAICAALTLATQSLLDTGIAKIDADAQARLVFDRISLDLAAMIRRSDVDYILKNNIEPQAGSSGSGVNDSLAFYARASGYIPSTSPPATAPSPRKDLSLVAYRVNSQTYQLERLAKGTDWYGTPTVFQMVFLPATLAGTWGNIATVSGGIPDLTAGTDSDYQVLADGVFRFEYCYLLKDGTFSILPWVSSHSSLNGWQDVVALYVAIAVLDDRSRIPVTGVSNNPSLAAATAVLTDFTSSTGTPPYVPPVAQWQTVLNQANFATQLGLPPKVAAAVRIFARTIPINNLPPDSSL